MSSRLKSVAPTLCLQWAHLKVATKCVSVCVVFASAKHTTLARRPSAGQRCISGCRELHHSRRATKVKMAKTIRKKSALAVAAAAFCFDGWRLRCLHAWFCRARYCERRSRRRDRTPAAPTLPALSPRRLSIGISPSAKGALGHFAFISRISRGGDRDRRKTAARWPTERCLAIVSKSLFV